MVAAKQKTKAPLEFVKTNPMEKSMVLDARMIRAPGIHAVNDISMALEMGRQIRDELVHAYPLLPNAVDIFEQMASTREWKISGPPRMVPRAVEALNNAETVTDEGYSEYGFEQLQKRRSRDHVCIGRTAYHWPEGGMLQYLDPTRIVYDIGKSKWYDDYLGIFYERDDVVIHNAKPIGGTGNFLSPLYSVLPTAILAWLLREHDTYSLDGRRIRDIMVVNSHDMATQIATAVEDTINAWSKPNLSELGIPIVYTEDDVTDVTKLITYIGLSKLPEAFDRDSFYFDYANTIAGATGLPLRRIWNSEKATNRALEQVQEQRQEQTGPSAYTRSEQRLLNGRNGVGSHYGRKTRFGFVEDVDIESQKVNAEVLKLYAEGLQIFAAVFGGKVNGDALLAWLQSEGVLPEDLKLITDIGTMTSSDGTSVPTDGNIQNSSDKPVTAILPSTQKSYSDDLFEKSFEDKEFLDYGEITMNSQGKVIERRAKVFSFARALEKSLALDSEFLASVEEEAKPIDYTSALLEARKRNKMEFISIITTEKAIDPKLSELTQEAYRRIQDAEELEVRDHRKIAAFLKIYRSNKPKEEIAS